MEWQYFRNMALLGKPPLIFATDRFSILPFSYNDKDITHIPAADITNYHVRHGSCTTHRYGYHQALGHAGKW
jgi:hypothetical protein